MKTAIFINTFTKMSNYKLDEFLELDLRMIALVAESEYEKFCAKFGLYFAEIIECKMDKNSYMQRYDYEFVKNIVSKELTKINGESLRIISCCEDHLLLAAQLREEFSIPGMHYKQALNFRDKVEMKNTLRAHNIRVPHYERFNDANQNERLSDFNQLQSRFGLPFVLKPTAMLGGFGVAIVSSAEEFEAFYQMKAPNEQYEVEEFISGTLYHCDAIRQNGVTLFSVCCEYTNPNFDFQLGKSVISMPLREDEPHVKEIVQFNERVLNALEFQTGVTHHELFVNNMGEVVFLEIGARSPGDPVSALYYEAFNLCFENCDAKMQLDIPLELKPTTNVHVMSGTLPKISGIVDKLISPELNSPFDIKWAIKEGDFIPESNSIRDCAATITAKNNDYKTLRSDFLILKDFCGLQVK